MSDMSGFGKLVPGFDFLQNLVKGAGSALPGIGQWVAPTLDPAEIEKRINELRTVQYWLEQNARMLAATIQALEVQRMTLTTLKTMNVPMAELTESLKIRPARPKEPAPLAMKREPAPPAAKKEPAKSQAAVDPMQWWGALTQQFTQLATAAMKDGASGAAKTMADAFTPASTAAASPAKTPAVKRAPAARKAAPRKRAAQRP